MDFILQLVDASEALDKSNGRQGNPYGEPFANPGVRVRACIEC